VSSPSRAILTGADAAVAALEATDAHVAFGLPGVHNLSLWRALGGSPIRLVGVRHEQTAAYAADGYARARGGLGVALTTTGPGAANTLAAVGEAWACRQPVLVIATDVPTSVRRPGQWRGALHEATDQAAMFEPVVKAALRVRSAEELGPAVTRAAAIALTPPRRPVYLEVPTDLLDADAGSAAAEAPATPPPGPVDEAALAGAAALIEAARTPLLWVGGGAVQAGAGPAVARLAERLAAPVILTYSARGLMPPDHPCLVTVPPHVPEAGGLWDDADLVLAIGTDLDGMMTQGWAMPAPPRLVAVNLDGADAAKNYAPDVLVEADAALAVEALAARVPERPGLDELAGRLGGLARAALEEVRRADPEAAEFLEALDGALPDDAIVVCDMCIPGYWLGGFRSPAAPRKLSYPLGWGTLGCAFPQGIGAALADRGRAVSVSGDGGFLYACGELAAAAQERIPLTAVVVDDGGYGMLRFDQDRRGDPHEGVDLVTPDFVGLAGSFGVPAEAVDGLGPGFAEALARNVALDEPSLLVARAAIGPPPNTSPRWYRTARKSR
jgi:thiamine pyrophosphate-dependent acetolactate synthase large subunit-like protein